MKTHFVANGFDLTIDLEKYARHKLVEIGRWVPRSLRAQASCTINFDQKVRKNVKLNTCTIVVVLPEVELHSSETTSHMYAALDIAAVNIHQQLREYARRNQTRGLRVRIKKISSQAE
jgi:ribosomal subunit interface protein